MRNMHRPRSWLILLQVLYAFVLTLDTGANPDEKLVVNPEHAPTGLGFLGARKLRASELIGIGWMRTNVCTRGGQLSTSQLRRDFPSAWSGSTCHAHGSTWPGASREC